MVTARHRDAPVSVVVFARRPRAGHVKRRLARRLGARAASRVYAGLLATSLLTVSRARGVRRVLLADKPRDQRWFRSRVHRPRWQVRGQTRGDLGSRMRSAFTRECDGRRSVLLVGSDIADFVCADLVAAANALDAGADVVIGPAADGGYWLIGMRQVHGVLFHRIRWGSAAVFDMTLAAAAKTGLSVARIAERHDIDRVGDLHHLRRWEVQRRRARSRSSLAT